MTEAGANSSREVRKGFPEEIPELAIKECKGMSRNWPYRNTARGRI